MPARARVLLVTDLTHPARGHRYGERGRPAQLPAADRVRPAGHPDAGIQRVDAGRTRSGELLLVEPEDLHPYLSLDLVPERTRDAFVTGPIASLRRALAG